MKKNLFLLVMGLLSSVTSFAQPEGWNDPATSLVKTTNIITDGSTVYYLKNETVGGWFVQGNSWWTQACVTAADATMPETSPYGFQVRFSTPTTHEGFYQMECMSPDGKFIQNQWKYVFDNAGTIYTDYGNQGIDKTYWKFTFDADNNATFVSFNNQDKNVGLQAENGVAKFYENDGASSRSGGSATGAYTMNNTGNEVATTWSLWSMGAPEAVAEWNAANALWNRMDEVFQDSEGNFEVDAYAEQIGEQKGTLENAERLTSVLAQLNKDYLAWKLSKATGDSPVTIDLVNPGFETGNMNGWSALSGTTIYAAQSNKAFDRTVGNYYAEFWHKNGDYSASQVVKDMPAGLYKLSANVYSSNGKAVLFMNDVESAPIEVSNRYSIGLELKEGVDTIKLGVKSSDNSTAWNCVDEFSLVYLGNDGTSWAALFETDYTGKASKQYVDGLAEKVAAIRTATGDAIKTAYEAAKAYEDGDVAENIAAWTKYEAICNDAIVLSNDPQFKDFATKLAAMIQQKFDITADNPSTAELNDAYNEILAEMNEVKSHIQPGTDITATYLKNADFTKDLATDPTKGWVIEGTKTDGCNWRISTGDKCGECWNGKDFDFYQIVENAPVGVYQIEVQGFTRANRGAASWGYYFNAQTGELLEKPVFGDWQANKANVYLNDNTGELSISYAYGHTAEEAFFTKTDVYTDPLGQFIYPDGMGSAGESFAAGEYKVSAFGLVAKQGDQMRIGVKGNNYGKDNWAIFTNFKLTYQGFDAEIIKPEFDKAVASLGEAHVGTELQEELKELQGRAAAVSQSDGKAMFDILSEIYAFNTKKASSEEVFAELNTQTKNLQDAFATYKDTATENAVKAAQALNGKAADAYADEETGLPTVTTEAAQKMLEEFAPVIAALRIPKDNGSDENPADFTSVIVNPTMASDNGWTDEKSNATFNATVKAAEFFNKESYNVYQKVTGLAEGLYEFQVNGYYRAGAIAEDWPAVAAETESNAMMYVICDNKTAEKEEDFWGADTLNCPLRHISTEAVNEDPSISGTTTFMPFEELGDKTPWYMPNDMASGAEFFNAGSYVNVIRVYVWGPDDTITFGVKKNGPAIASDWCMVTNWKLTGYGNMSEKDPGAVTNSCDPASPVFNSHYALTALIAEATTYAESIATEFKDVATELRAAIESATVVNDNVDATDDEIAAAVEALQSALDAAKKATSISEVVVKNNKALADGKYLKGGKLIIVKNGKKYSAAGAVIK